jgi:hypothetical protein
VTFGDIKEVPKDIPILVQKKPSMELTYKQLQLINGGDKVTSKYFGINSNKDRPEQYDIICI